MSEVPAATEDPAVPLGALRHYLGRHTPQFEGEFTLQRLGEGQSCLTYLLEGKRWEVVLRRPPRGDLPPTAFDVTREFRVMKALYEHDSGVPVPRPILLCSDRDVLGAPFYLMEKVEGDVVRGELPPNLSTEEDRGQMGRELLDTLLALGRVDYREVGLEGFGKPAGYLDRQLLRMHQLWQMAKFRELPDIEEVGMWLAEHPPPERAAAIVHGDFKLDNVVFAPKPPATIVAVVDWEMSTIGDALADLGWLLYFWRDPGDPELGLRIASVTDLPGFPRRRDLLERYAAATPIDEAHIPWYVALAGWKIAIIMEGSYKRFRSGITDHPAFAQLEEAVPALARRARQAIRRELPL
jgi:aminoglycoside phosphotransferase (APT) family kinase protein